MITDVKLKSLFELKKSISVSYRELTMKGLLIDYTINGKEKTLQANPLETCGLLKCAGLINKFEKGKSKIYLSWESELNHSDAEGNHVQQAKTVYGSFNDFVEQTFFSTNDANEVVAFHERRNISLNNKKAVAV